MGTQKFEIFKEVNLLEQKILSDYLEEAASTYPEKEAIIFQERRISYEEFYNSAKNLAKAFLHMGIKKGDRIAVLMPNSPEYLFTYMACSMIGAVLVGINTSYKGAEIAYFLNNSQPRALVVIEEYRRVNFFKMIGEYVFPGIIPYIIIQKTNNSRQPRGTYSFDELLHRGQWIKDEELKVRKKSLSPEDNILIIYTSGTTGKAKGVVLTHKNIISTISLEVKEWEISPEDKIILHLPMSHIGGATELSIAGLMAAATVVVMDHFNPVEALKLIQKERITFLGQVPTMFYMMFNVSDFEQYDLSSIRICAVAGAPTSSEILKKMRTIGHGDVRAAYGLAEAAGLVTYTAAGESLDRLTVTVGRPAAGFSIKIVDDYRKEVLRGEIGEVAIKGDGVFKEYFDLPDETEKATDKEGWFYTGDLGLIDNEGYLQLMGRKKDIIITGGFTVFPREIEETLMQHPKIKLAAVCGVPDPLYGEAGRAYIVTEDGEALKQAEILSYLEMRLAKFKIPTQYVFRSSLPLTPTGKVEKRLLQEEIANEG